MEYSQPILLIDDEPNLRDLYSRILSLDGFKVNTASTGNEGIELLKKTNYAVLITDVKLPDVNGIDLIKTAKEITPDIEVIAITAYGNINDGVQAMKNGAYDYITKGDIDEDKFILTIKKAYDKVNLKHELTLLKKRVEPKFSFDRIIGSSKSIREAIELGEKVAPTDAGVLLLGETGSGKELFAEAIHNSSLRKLQPFLELNCSAIPEDLQESELFGYVKGAFTGALQNKKGLFEEADKGTVFLDEVADMSLDTQTKLLRVLESGTFNKLGDTKNININVRLIAATNKDIEEEIKNNRFRLDLYYRINTFIIKLPSLNERKEDIQELVNHFIPLYNKKLNKNISGTSPEFIAQLKRHNWRGNVRELKNIIERAVILSNSDILNTESLPKDFDFSSDAVISLADAEKEHIRKTLSRTGEDKAEAAKLLGIGLTTLYRKIKEYGL